MEIELSPWSYEDEAKNGMKLVYLLRFVLISYTHSHRHFRGARYRGYRIFATWARVFNWANQVLGRSPCRRQTPLFRSLYRGGEELVVFFFISFG